MYPIVILPSMQSLHKPLASHCSHTSRSPSAVLVPFSVIWVPSQPSCQSMLSQSHMDLPLSPYLMDESVWYSFFTSSPPSACLVQPRSSLVGQMAVPRRLGVTVQQRHMSKWSFRREVPTRPVS